MDPGLTTPLVSVLMSVFNGERWLAESIQSVLIQTFTDFEFLIVNDGSTDGSLEIIKHFAEQDSRLRVFDKPNTGLADSLNYGIERARGEWIARIDADDLGDLRRFEKQIALVRADKDLVLVGSGLKLIDQHGSEGKAYEYPLQHSRLVKRLATCGSFFPHSSAMYRTNLAREVGGYRARIRRAEDHDLWLRLSQRGFLGCIKEPLVLIRKHDDQISHDEGGRRQIVDSYVAMICYWLRQSQYLDPVESLPDPEFFEFYEWVEIEMESAGVFDLMHQTARIKAKLGACNFDGPQYFGLSRLIIGSPQKSFRWLTNRFFGSGLPQTLAKNWMRKSGLAV